MARPSSDVTDAELAVLQVLWELPGATIRQLTDRLYPRGGSSHFATVQKLLERLEGKRFVRREREASPQQFEAAVSRDQLLGQRLKTLAKTLCGGSITPLLTTLVQNESLEAGDRKALRDLIEQLDRKTGGKR